MGGRHTYDGVLLCPKGIICNAAITTSVPRSPQHSTSQLGLGEPQPGLPSQDITLHDYEDAYGWILERKQYAKTWSLSNVSVLQMTGTYLDIVAYFYYYYYSVIGSLLLAKHSYKESSSSS
jgi:hypothetical protein